MEINMDVWLISSFIALIFYWYFYKNANRFERSGIKHIKPMQSLYGFLKSMLMIEHMSKALDRGYKSFPEEKIIGFFEFQNPIIWIRDPETIKQITVKDFDHFTDHRNFLSESIDVLFTNNLFALKGQKWRDMRSTLSPAFTTSKMKSMFPLIEECSKQFVIFLENEVKLSNKNGLDHIELEAKDLFTRYANDVIATSAFGVTVDSMKYKSNEFYIMGKSVTDFSMWFFLKFWGFAICPKLMKFLSVSLMKEDVANFFRNLVNKSMQLREEKGINRPDMIQLLMQARNKGYIQDDEIVVGKSDKSKPSQTIKKWSDDELAAQAFVFFLAGFETVSSLMTFAAYEIAKNQEVQERLQDEIDELLKNEEKLTYDNISKMTYMDMFISETLRFWPLVVGVDRVCVKPYTIPSPNPSLYEDYKINVGEAVFIPIYNIHRDSKHFPEADKFMPERFSEENKANIQPFTYIPFGSGPRLCIGSRFALMEAKSILIALLSKFSFVKCSKTEDITKAKLKPNSMFPVNGIWIGLKLRE